MKELSIEEKAKAYDKAFERAKTLYDKGAPDSLHLEEMFPILKESQEERIRKELTDFIYDKADTYELREKSNSWLAWLEKQGGQKSTYKVEPKFKVGDWLIRNDIVGVACCIAQIHEPYYYLTNDHTFISFEEENKYRLWTIQDAKDGDVLFTSSTASHETFMFKSIDEKGNAKCYFAYDSEDGFREGKYHFIGRATNCKPATKEQRKLLFQKMKEAGYEWDAERKELKKVDTYCQDNCKGFQETGRCFFDEECKAKKEHNKQKLQDNNSHQIEQKLVEWNEEDEVKLKSACALIRNTSLNGNEGVVDSTIAWLKSLRPKWKPSEELMNNLSRAANGASYHTDLLLQLYIQLKQL